MSVSVTLPALGESVTEGTVTRWLKQVGDSVEADEPLLEVSTDKVDTEIPAPAAGTLLSITANEDDTVEVGAELGVIGSSSDEPAAGGSSGGVPSDDSQAAGADATEPAPTGQQASSDGAAASAPADSGHSVAAEVPGGQSGALPAEGAAPGGVEADSLDDQLREQAGGASEQASPQAGVPGRSPGGSGTSVTLPELGESVTEGTVTRWLKQIGDSVEADEPLLEVSTDKVDTEIPAPVAGTLLSITANEDDTVAVGAELAVIGTAGASAPSSASAGPAVPGPSPSPAPPPSAASTPSPAPAPEPADEPVQPVAAAAGAEPPPAPRPAPPPAPQPQAPQPQAPAASAASDSAAATAPDGGNPYVTPLVRRLAADSGVDLSTLTGSGVGGRIRKQDVLEAAEAARAAADEAARAAQARQAAAVGPAPVEQPATDRPTKVEPSPLRGTTEKMTRLRKVIATRMVESLQTSAQLTTVVEVDVTAVAVLRQRAKAAFEQREGVRLSFLPFFALATVEALKAMPKLNATLDTDSGEITYAAAENLGIAVDSERGLLVPVISDAGDLNLAGIARRIADLAARTRTNKLAPDELAGGTFTLTNTGSRGALFDTPILNQPQVGILGTGAVVRRPVVLDAPGIGETIAIRSMVYLALTYDHRLVDGADAARFLVAVKTRLEEGAFEAEVGL